MSNSFSRWLGRKSLSRSCKSVSRRPCWPNQTHLLLESLEQRLVPTSVVTTVADSGPGSLRQAIMDANAASGASVINFNIPGSGVQEIQLTSALPEITNSVDLDATTQPSYAGTPLIELNGTNAGSGVSGLVVSAPNSMVIGFDINGFSGDGITINAGSVSIQANYIGTDPTGMFAVDNGGNGISINNASSNTIGGLTSTPGTGAGNVISGNDLNGILVSGGGGNFIEGNLVGTNAPGNAIITNGAAQFDGVFGGWDEGIQIANSVNNTIGGTTATSRNIISGNTVDGVQVDGSGSTGNLIQGNFIGTDITGTVSLGNAYSGVSIYSNASGNTVGGVTGATLGGPLTGAGNLISGNFADGMYVADTTNNLIAGNYIGTNVAGTGALGNGANGIELGDASSNTIGGATPGAANVISANGSAANFTDGVNIYGASSSNNLIQGNFIGTNSAGTSALPNGWDGLDIGSGANSNTVGGTTAAARNIISGNFSAGVGSFQSGAGNVIEGNYLGTDVTGAYSLGVQATGISYGGASSGNTFGGTTHGAGNLISGNSFAGIYNFSPDSPNYVIEGNFIGTNAAGTGVVANFWVGIEVQSGSNTIGGTTAGSGNLISGSYTGIELDQGADNNLIEGNFIGTNADGSASLGNVRGISDLSSGNTIGGVTSIAGTGAGNVISGNSGPGIYVWGGSNNSVLGNLIGTDATGTFAIANGTGIQLDVTADNSVIGGTNAGDRNVISGNSGTGIQLQSNNNFVQGNFVGTDFTGSYGLGNGTGIVVSSSGNTIGGATTTPGTGAGNVISGNWGWGVSLSGAANFVQGNLIGANASGTVSIGNGGNDIEIGGNAIGNMIGGSDPSDRNILVGAGYFFGAAVEFDGTGPVNNVVANNYIGTDITGTVALGNIAAGVQLYLVPDRNFIGLPGAGNLISGNGYVGINIAGSMNTVVQGNRIGTNASGTAALSNGSNGILFNSGASNNTIGGTAAGAGNIISGNRGNGIEVDGGSNNFFEGNYVGTDVMGAIAVPNTGDGIVIQQGSSYNTIGGDTAGSGNLISGNGATGSGVSGLALADDGTSFNVIAGNLIGTNAAGDAAVPNAWMGIVVAGGASNNTIGGTSAGARNIISGNAADGIEFFRNSGLANVLEGNFIGTNLTGTLAVGNSGNGVQVDNGSVGATIGGTDAGAGNLISGNVGLGVALYAGASLVEGNRIGTDVTGTSAVGNGSGVQVASNSDGTIIGGTAVGAGNLISGNLTDGIGLNSGAALIEGNFIGTDVTGTHILGNGAIGVQIVSGSSYTIGGTAAGAGNLISGNGATGIEIDAAGTVSIQGNFIGTDITGLLPLGNSGSGILTYSSTAITIGGTTVSARNIISGNLANGVVLFSASNLVEGNFIGTDASGTVPLGNHNNGVQVFYSSGNTIGGTSTGASNLISGNLQNGIGFIGASDTLVEGNLIGTDVSGTLPLGNANNGIQIDGWSNTIGGTTTGAGNVISANGGSGVSLNAAGDWENVVQGNYIGADVAGTLSLGNGGDGVSVLAGMLTQIGDSISGAGNLISGNSGDGVRIDGATSWGTTIRGNSIHDNQALGIDLSGDGVTANDTGDADSGPNGLLNFPVLTTALPGATTTVSGTFNSMPVSTFTLDFYASATADPSGFGQGQIYLGSTTVTTDDSGNATFIVTGLAMTSGGQVISATATDAFGDTSEFSADVIATALTANAGGPYTSVEGGPLTLSGSLTSNPEGGPLTYTWSINGHDNAATGVSPSLTWLQLQALGIDDGPGTFAVVLTVTDAHGGSATSATTLSLTNTAPTASVNGPAVGVPGQPLSFTLGAADPSTADQTAGFSFSINWGDGHTESVSGLSGVTNGHAYAATGSYLISVTATDQNGGVSTAVTQTVTIAKVEVEGTTLAVGGTTGDDSFVLTPVTTSTIKVVLNGTNLGTFSNTSLQLYGDGGTDTVSISGTSGDDVFSLAGTTATVNVFTVGLNNMQSVTENGLAGNDSFTNTLATISSTLLGVGNNDTFVFAGGAMGARASISGGAGQNTLIAPDMPNVWTITAANAGTLNGDSFTGIQNLVGGSLHNDVVFANGASLGGSISGTGGVTIDDSQISTSVTLNLQTNKVTGVGGTVADLVSIIGGSAANTLIGANATNGWTIDSANGGTVNGIVFTGFGSLTGGTDDDTFTVGAAGSVDGALSGGAGTNTLVGPNIAGTFAITANNAGGLNGAQIPAFSKIQNLSGGTGSYRFVFSAGAKVAGSIDGGLGGGTLDYSAYTSNVAVNLQTNTVSGVTGTATNITSVIGGSGTNTLTGPNGGTRWNVTSANAGSINGAFSFAGFGSLIGGTGANDFVLSNGAGVTGNINASAGAGTLDYSSYSTGISVNLQSNVVTGVGGKATGMTAFIGGSGSNSLTGANVANTWNITGSNAGNVNGTVAFTAFATLTGGSNNDGFVFSAGAGVSGSITGKGGTNRLDYTSFGNSVYVNMFTAAATGTGGIANVQQVYGSGMGDVLVGDGANVLLSESAGKNLIIGGTHGGATLISGSGEDIVIAGSTIYDNDQAALQAIENFWATDAGSFSDRTAALAAGITGGYALNTSTVTHHTGAADIISLNSALDWLFWRASGSGADTLSGTPARGQHI